MNSPSARYISNSVISFSAVMMLITDLDRPMMSMFKMNDQVLLNLAEKMDETLLKE